MDGLDRQLVDRMRARDESAVEKLAADYGQKVFQLAFRYTRNHEDAEEVAQDVLMKVYRNIEAFRGDAALSSWIYRIAFNTVMSRLRAKKARSGQLVKDGVARREEDLVREPLEGVADRSMLADDQLLRSEVRDRLARAIRGLPPIYRLPVLLRDVFGLSTEEASARLRVKGQTLKSRLHRGRLMLRRQLADFAGALGSERRFARRRVARRPSDGVSARH
ncbi:MAG: RNA polymerase sigma factor [Vicinamibacterales bacterium]